MTDVETRLSSLEQKITTMGTLQDIKQVLIKLKKIKKKKKKEKEKEKEKSVKNF